MATYNGADKRLAYLFQNGGGGGGSTVSITPTLQSGTKIADYEIDGDAGELYAPAGGGGAGVVTPLWSGALNTQGGTAALSESYKHFNILIIKWSAQANTDYYQDNVVIPTAEIVNGQTYQFGASFIRSTSFFCQMAFSMSNDTTFSLDQIQITGAQAGVTIQAIYGVNVGGGGVHVYSTSEQIIGTWVDGSNIYEQTYEVTITTTLGTGVHDIVNKPNIRLIDYEGFGYGISNQRCYPLPYAFGNSTTVVAYNLNGNGYINLRINNDSWSSAYKFWITARYLKLT